MEKLLQLMVESYWRFPAGEEGSYFWTVWLCLGGGQNLRLYSSRGDFRTGRTCTAGKEYVLTKNSSRCICIWPLANEDVLFTSR